MRWQAGETRDVVFWLADNTDVAAVGLTPTVAARRVSDGAVLAAPSATEVGGGFYSFSFTAPDVDSYVFLVDGGATLDNAHRYVPLEVPAGGYPDTLDVDASSRASATALQTVDDLVDDLEGRITPARAALVDNLDVAVSTRATPADVDVEVTVASDPTGEVS